MKTVKEMLSKAEAEVPHIRPQEAKELLGTTDVLFLDVREPNEIAASGGVWVRFPYPEVCSNFGLILVLPCMTRC
jgi:hypothetical protein